MKLVAFKYGTTELSESVAFLGGDRQKNLLIDLTFFLIETENKKILVDVGSDDMPGFNIYKFKKPIDVLSEYGVTPDEITDIILTHSHFDHIGAIGYYKNAMVHVNEYELENALKKMPKDSKVRIFSESYTIFDGITIKHIGGHTKGSSIVLIDAEDTVYALCGDECYFYRNLSEKIPTATTKNLKNSKAFVEEYSRECYTPIIFHETGLVYDIGFKVIYEI